MSTLPKQKIPRAEKTTDWIKNTTNAIIDSASFGMGSKSYQNLFMLRDAYWGRLDLNRFTYVTNPYSAPDGRKLNFPAKLRNMNIIKPIVNTMLGEKSRRPFEYLVVALNADVQTRHDEAVQKSVMATLTQQFINNLNASGMDTGMESKPTEAPDKVAGLAKQNYKDARAIMGQNALTYLRDYLDLPDKFQQLFLDMLITGEMYTYKAARRDDADYEVVMPEDIWYPRSANTRYVEDADRVVRKRRMSVNQIVDSFYDLLKDEEIDALESGASVGVDGLFLPQRDSGTINTGDLDVLHVCWKSFTPLWIISFPDELGQMQQMTVDETYKVAPGETVEKFWVGEWWECWRIDNRFWIGGGPVNVQRRSLSNLSECKGPYNGYRMDSSVVADMLPYQDLYNIFHYRLELSIAKNKDKIALMEINMIPKKAGWDEDKFMYYADAMGYAWIDSTAEGKSGERPTFNSFQVLDMSLGQYIAAQFQLLQAIKTECEEIVGFTPQRKGQVLASAGNGATERAVFQSSVITEELFRQSEKFQEKECQGLLDLSKQMWREGKKSTFLSSDYRQQVLSIDGDDYPEAELGVFVKSGAKESDKVAAFKQIAQAYMQNGGDLLTVAEILDNENFAQIKEKVAEAETARKAYEQQASQQQQQLQQQQIDANREAAEQASLDEMDAQTRLFAHEKELKLMDIEAKMAAPDTDGDGTPDWVEEQSIAVKREQIASDERIELRRQALDKEKLSVEREKIKAMAAAKKALGKK